MVTKTKQVSKNKNEAEAIKVVSKSEYEKLVRKCKRLERSQDKTVQRVEDLEDIIKLMRWYDNCKNGFIFNYLKPRYRPKMSEDGEKELYSDDGRHWYPVHAITLEPSGFTRNRFGKGHSKIHPLTSSILTNPFGSFMNYNKPMDDKRYWKLEEMTEKIAGRKSNMNFSDPKEDEEFDRICRNMA